MKKLLIFLGALAAYGTDCTISDTVRTPFGGYFAGRIVVALNGPGSAQPLYSGSQTLTGWQTTIEVPASANGAVAVTLVCTDTITPSGTSYSARYQPTSGSPWSETWTPTTGTTTIRAMRATTVPTPTTTFQASQIVPGTNGQVLTTTAGASAWGSVPACATCVVTSGSYADPAWITSLAGSKVSGAVASATLAASATALATPRTIAGVSFNGTANISIPSTGLSDTANIVRNNAANTYTAGSKQTFAHSATTAGLNVGVQAAAPSSPAQGDVFFNSTLTRKGVYDGTQWRYELYAPSSGTGVVSWDGTSLSASTTLAGLASVTSTSFTGALTGNASTATALASTVASGRLWIGQGTGVPTSDSVICADTTNHRLGVGTCSPGQTLTVVGGNTILPASPYSLYIGGVTDSAVDGMRFVNAGAASYLDIKGATGLILRSDNSTGSTERLRLVSGTGDLLIGTATDLGYGLHAANKATNGNFLCFDPTATTGTTNCVFKAGQGQSGTVLKIQTYAGVNVGYWDGTGGIGVTGSIVGLTGDLQIDSASGGSLLLRPGSVEKVRLASGSLQLPGTSFLMAFSNDTTPYGTKDLSLSRASAGVLQVGDGGANANGYLSAARIGVGTTSPGQAVQVVGNVQIGGSSAFNNRVDFVSDSRSISFSLRGGGAALPGMFELYDNTAAASRMAFATTGNILIGGGTTDGNYRLDVNSSGTSGTLRVYDQTATTGNTKEVIRAGAGQTTNLTEWQNNAGTVMTRISSTGAVITPQLESSASFTNVGDNTYGYIVGSGGGLVWSSTSVVGGTKDTGLARAAAGYLKVTDGSTGLGKIVVSQSTPAASTDACTAGALWADATYIYACTASGTIKRATLASF